ncbi:RNA polymerase II subunit A C-terminal domain phosphatase-like isoform X1 [Styela clava]
MAEIKLVHVPGHKPIRILKWLVKKGEWIKHGTPLAIYRHVEDPTKQTKMKELHLKSKHVGTVKMFLMHEGQVAISEGVLLEIEGCAHPVVMKDMCAECGQDLRMIDEGRAKHERQKSHSATVSMIPSIPELRISAEQAEEIAQQDKNRLHRMKKLVLLVDLDQTLIHTTQDPGLAALCHSTDEFYSFQLSKNDPMLFTKLRPHCREFLKEISQRYELQIVTFGSRQYAHKIADFIDKEKKYFAHRILSRDECIHPFKKSGNLRHLFPCGDSMVCIIDDRDDVWNAVPNLIMVRKYNYFQGTGDINNPYKKELQKTEIEVSRRKRKSEEEGTERVSDAKRTKEDIDGPLDSNKNKIVTKDEVDDDLNISSDSESSSDSGSSTSSSDNSTSDGEDTQKSEALSQPSVDQTSEQNGDKSPSVSHESQQKEQNSVTPEENSDTKNGLIEEKKLPNGKETKSEVEGNSSSGETLPVSSQEPESSQETFQRELSGFSKGGESQEFVNALSSQEESSDMRQNFQDNDDYLKYLQDILTQIHNTYYEAYEKYLNKDFKDLPDVRGVVPFLRSKVLYGCSIVFTGVIPQTFTLPKHRHRAYVTARQLGAQVEDDVSDRTTHLIAMKKGTTKYQDALKRKKIKMVAVEWLWCCSERWEKVEEKIFPVPNKYIEKDKSIVPAEQVQEAIILQNRTQGTYDPVTGKLIKKVQDPRFSFMVAESQHRKKEPQAPLYSSLLVPDEVVPVDPVAKKCSTPSSWKHNVLSKSNTAPVAARSRKRSMVEIVGIGYSLSTDDIADMDKEVDDLLGSSDEEEDKTEDRLQGTSAMNKPQSSENLGTLVEEDPTLNKDSQEDESDDDDFDEMAALLNAEMHYEEQ